MARMLNLGGNVAQIGAGGNGQQSGGVSSWVIKGAPVAANLVTDIAEAEKFGDEMYTAAKDAGFSDEEAKELAHNGKMVYGSYKALTRGTQSTLAGGTWKAALGAAGIQIGDYFGSPEAKDWIKNTIIQNRKELRNQANQWGSYTAPDGTIDGEYPRGE
ncbi:MAG: hypothetical protein P4N59_18235 [Negativicutes bacterium]|nr:hypothetical protein [Negativicutes bacterium]